jgi:hypothetical protein
MTSRNLPESNTLEMFIRTNVAGSNQEASRLMGHQYGRRAKTPDPFYRSTLKPNASDVFRPSTSYSTVSRTGFAVTDGSVIRKPPSPVVSARQSEDEAENSVNADGTPNLFMKSLYTKTRGPGSYMPRHTGFFTSYMNNTAWPAYPCSAGTSSLASAGCGRGHK